MHLAVPGDDVQVGHAVLRLVHRQLVPIVQELREIVHDFRADAPSHAALHVADRRVDKFEALGAAGLDDEGVVNVLPPEVQLLRDCLHVVRADLRHFPAEGFLRALGVFAENHGIRPVADAHDAVVRMQAERGLPRRFNVRLGRRGGDVRRADRSCADLAVRRRRAQRHDRLAVREKGVVHHAQKVEALELDARSVHARLVPAADKALRLVQGHVALDAVAEAFADQRRVVGEPVRAVRIHPAAPVPEFLRVVPVEEREEGRDAGFEKAVDQLVVEVDAFLIHRAGSVGEEARPGHGEAVALDADLLHDGDVFLVAVVVVAGHVAGVALKNVARLLAEGVPDGQALAVLVCSAFDLERRRRRAPQKIVAKRHVLSFQSI